ncbi:hypothetical protein [Leptolyngbya sp. GGD]|uniref:hypothetical protein n=1 Tax=Leptolyngbya sp. GGD TaxID=2997907 RepID=UPI00227BA44E|nr:hypothetical protein [Leptolyngbya sp. GGD]MCY6490274.1 hypothetical protein [Leptolyngbya sp. GGD]
MRRAPRPKQNGDSNAIILDWTISGRRYTLSPPGKWNNSDDVDRAAKLGEKIYEDYKTGNFDDTLKKYLTPEQIKSQCTPDIRFKNGVWRVYLTHEGQKLDWVAMSEQAKKLAAQIEQDCVNGCVDSSGQKYLGNEVRARAEESDRKWLEKQYAEATQFRASLELYEEFVSFKNDELQYSSSGSYRTLLNRLKSLPMCDTSKASDLEEMLKTNFPYNAELAKKYLNEARDLRRVKPLEDKAKKNLATCFTAFGNWLVEKKGYSQNPYRGLEIKINKKSLKKKTFDTEEIQRIIAYFTEKIPFYANFADFRFRVGMRSGELAALKWADIDWKNAQILVHDSLSQHAS